MNTILEKWDGIDVLINNAVYWGNPANRGKKFEEMPIKQWEEVFKINLLGTVYIIQRVVPRMRRNKWGRIVNLSSGQSIFSGKFSESRSQSLPNPQGNNT